MATDPNQLHDDVVSIAKAIDAGGAVRQGTATLVAGTVTVADAKITANSTIRILSKTLGGTPGAHFISAKSVGVSFTITSTSNTDTSTVNFSVIDY